MPAAAIGALAGGALGAAGVGGLTLATGAALGAGIGGAFDEKDAAEDAADAQVRAADEATRVQWEMFQQQREDLAPWLEAGEAALGQFETALGGGPAALEQFEAYPGYEFSQQEGQRAIEQSAAARGGLFSGRTGRELQRYGQGLAQQQYGDYLNRLAALSGIGQTTGAQLGQFGAGTAQGVGLAQLAGGTAQASGIIGGQQAMTQGLGNALYGLQAFGNPGGLYGGLQPTGQLGMAPTAVGGPSGYANPWSGGAGFNLNPYG